MRRRKVWRYYCDFCKKANCSGASIKKHESRCTLNPDRHCGMCAIFELSQTDLPKAMALLPDPKQYEKADKYGFLHRAGLEDDVSKALPKLRDFVEDCPACIMAALRQKGIPVPMVKEFDFKKERESWWSEYNSNQQRLDEESTYHSDICYSIANDL